MKKTEYLYSIKPSQLDDLMYFKALEFKKASGERLFRELFFKHNPTEGDKERLFWVRKAQDHTQKLLDERYE